MANGGLHLTNGSNSRAALNSDDSQEGSVNEPLINGHHAGKENMFPSRQCLAFCGHAVLLLVREMSVVSEWLLMLPPSLPVLVYQRTM